MPELPEVESVKRSLSKKLPKGARWTEVTLTRKDLRIPFPKDLKEKLLNSEVLGIERRSKFLIFKRKEKDLISHLGMSGTWREIKNDEEIKLHDHVIFAFDNGLRLVYNDPRRFGLLAWGGEESPWLKKLGPEPLTAQFTSEYFFNQIKKSRSSIKVLLMNPKVVVGVGNIYASEIFYFAGVKPTRLGLKVTKADCEKIVCFTKEVLKKAIQAKGSTLKDYKLVNGESGKFQNSFQVYSRAHQPCRQCLNPIRSQVIGQRSTFWCSQCQR